MAESLSTLRQVIRRLSHTPRFTSVAVLTLAIAVGANAAVFAALYSVLLKPLAYPQSDRLVSVRHRAPGAHVDDLDLGPANYFVYRDQSKTFEALGVYSGAEVSVTGTGEPEQVRAIRMTEGVLPVLGVAPAAGRFFSATDADPKSPATVILGHAYWLRKFSGAVAAVGSTVQIDGQPMQIIGVLPSDFRFIDGRSPAVVLPLRFNRAETPLGQFHYDGVARLRPGATVAQANDDVGRMLLIVQRAFPPPRGVSAKLFEDAHIGPNVRPLKDRVIGDSSAPLKLLMGCIAIVFLIACANVANLWLVRLEDRRREIALRTALGGGRFRIARELLLEALGIGLASAIAGLAIAALALRAFLAATPVGFPRLEEIHLDLTTAAFTFSIATAASLLFGALPILKYIASPSSAGLRDAGRSLTNSRRHHRIRSGLVVAQVSLALVLLIGSALMGRTLIAMTSIDPGFKEPETIQVFRAFIPASAVQDPDRVIQAQEDIRRQLAAIPGVSVVAVAAGVPLDGNDSADPVFAQDRAYREGELPPIARSKFVMPGYFTVIGARLIAGRDFTWPELHQHAPLAIVSRRLAVEYWSTPQQALGRRIRVATNDDWREVIGVAADTYDDGVTKEPTRSVYWPMVQNRFDGDVVSVQRSAAFILRTPRAGTEALQRDMRQAVWSVNPNLPLFSVQTLGDLNRRSMARTSFMLMLLAVASGMALLLGIVGLYGVTAYAVSQRTREIGLRMALGAQPTALTGMFVREGLTLTIVGIVIGVITALLAGRLMRALLFNVTPTDPLTYLLVAFALVAICVIAAYLPSRRAAGVDPWIALKGE
jgi:predicted permease